jgi:hypothetical protein
MREVKTCSHTVSIVLMLLIAQHLYPQVSFVGSYHVADGNDSSNAINCTKSTIKINSDKTFIFNLRSAPECREGDEPINFVGSWVAHGDTIYLHNKDFKYYNQLSFDTLKRRKTGDIRIRIYDAKGKQLRVVQADYTRRANVPGGMRTTSGDATNVKELLISDSSVAAVRINAGNLDGFDLDLSPFRQGSDIRVKWVFHPFADFFNGVPYLYRNNKLMEAGCCQPFILSEFVRD